MHAARVDARVDARGLAAAVTTALTWGLVGTMVRLLPALTPIEVVAGRLAFALAAAVPALAVPHARAQVRDAARRGPAWALAALMGGYYLLAVIAFRLAPVADVALLLATAPLCALGLRRLGGAAVTAAERDGALLALAGVALTLVPSLQTALAGAGDAARLRLLGDALALAAATASAAYAMRFRAAQAARTAPTPLGVALLTFALGTAALAARALVAGAPLVPVSRLDVRALGVLAALGVVSTLVPTLAFATAARRLPPVLTSATQLLVPVVSALAAAATLGERPSAWLLPGGALVAIGLLRLVRGTR
ncbi:EamA family transporter [Roseisolibacter agri]|uniref:EamA family transporter n=1 Tax=Roseisolibacter agri TaxID=2014610 RepID=UPI0024E0C666|nr:EamA family transporter [Roseisolibacter agri]